MTTSGSNMVISEEDVKRRDNSISSSDSWEAELDLPRAISNNLSRRDFSSSSSTRTHLKFNSGNLRPLDPVSSKDSLRTGLPSQITARPKQNLIINRAPAKNIPRSGANIILTSAENKSVLSRATEVPALRNAQDTKSPTRPSGVLNKRSGTVPLPTPLKPLIVLQPAKQIVPSRNYSDLENRPAGMRVNPKPSNCMQDCESSQGQLPDSAEKVKSKLISVWNNMKYGWTVPNKTKFSFLSPIFLLGHCYQEDATSPRLSATAGPMESPIEKFKLDFTSRIWLTYRRDFPVLYGSNYSTDCGWGCMLRSGQMMLAQALVCHFLGRSWRCSGVPQTEKSDALHRSIIKWFADSLSEMCPLSIHNLVKAGESFGRKAGDWYGPASVAHILKVAVENGTQSSPLLDEICVYVAQDCTVYKADVEKLCRSPRHVQKIADPPPRTVNRKRYPNLKSEKSVEEAITWSDAVVRDNERNAPEPSQLEMFSSPPMSPLSRTWSNPVLARSCSQFSESDYGNYCGSMAHRSFGTSETVMEEGSTTKWRGVIILVPVRLGGERLNPIYIPCLKRILALDSSVGIIGGRPRHALYFVGFQDDRLIHLDPHYCQDYVDVRPADFPLNSFHCTVPKKIPLVKMDPSCTIGFYLRTHEEFEKFIQNVTPLLVPLEEKLEYPIFVVNEGSSSSVNTPSFSNGPNRSYKTEDDRLDSDSDPESENFVFL